MKQILSFKRWSGAMVAGSVLFLCGNAWASSSCGFGEPYGPRRYDAQYWNERGRQHPRHPWAYRTVYVTRRPACYVRSVSLGYQETVVINVPNDNGSYTPVTLRQEDGTYIGPRGERYLSMPTVEQLKAVYGLK